MRGIFRVRALLAALVVLAGLLGGAGTLAVFADGASAHAAGPWVQLKELTVRPAGDMDGYSREKFPHWSNAQEYGWKIPSFVSHPGSCDARDAALIRDGKGQENVGRYCDVNSGTWYDPYTGQTFTNPSDIDIDHFVPLANAWRSGAAGWGAAKKERFANVPQELLSVEDNANASKGDRGPEAWKPPRKAYHCKYATKWIRIKHDWKLSVTRSEKVALKEMLAIC